MRLRRCSIHFMFIWLLTKQNHNILNEPIFQRVSFYFGHTVFECKVKTEDKFQAKPAALGKTEKIGKGGKAWIPRMFSNVEIK